MKRRSTRRTAAWAVAVIVALAGLGLVAIPPLRLVAMHFVLSRVTLSHFDVESNQLIMTGAINRRSPDQFERLLDTNPEVDTLVPADGLAESGGVDLFIAGDQRTVVPGGRLGVQEWQGFTSTATDFPRDAVEHREYIARAVQRRHHWLNR